MVKVYSQNSKSLLTLYESLSPKAEYDSSHMFYYLHQLEHFLWQSYSYRVANDLWKKLSFM
jgi:hypothetical protein